MIWKMVTASYFKVLPWHSSEETGKSQEKRQDSW